MTTAQPSRNPSHVFATGAQPEAQRLDREQALRSRIEAAIHRTRGQVQEQLLVSGFLDSIGAMELVAAVQQDLGIALPELQIGDLATVTTLVAAVAAAHLPPRVWSTIDDLLGAVLDRAVPRAELQAFVIAQWNARRFAFHADAMAAWLPKVTALAERAGVTHHGRREQPVCPSRHLFGDHERVAARVVFDPPSSPERPETVEFHTHPVDSVIVVLGGGGSYRVCHRDTAGRTVVVDVPLEPGSVVCFPRDVIHTIECGPQGIETLNITDRLNQPAWRDDPTLPNTGPAASADFARAVEPPAGAPIVPYAKFAAAV